MYFDVKMPNFTLHFSPKDTDACKIIIAADLSGVALSLNILRNRESGMNSLYF